MKKENMILRMSVTNKCNLGCSYCDPDNSPGRTVSFEQMCQILLACHTVGFRNIHWTGGEPMMRADLADIIAYAKNIGFQYQKMTSNGAKIAQHAKILSNAGLNRINISLDTLYGDKYKEITKVNCFEKVIDGITAAAESFEMVKINKCVTQLDKIEIPSFIEFVKNYQGKVYLKLLELVPCGNRYQMDQLLFDDSFVAVHEMKSIICDHFGPIAPVEIGGHSRKKCEYYQVQSNKVIFGLNPNQSIEYACQKGECKDFRFNPQGYLSDCSTNLAHMIHLPSLSLEQKVAEIEKLVEKKYGRTEVEWEPYTHKQKYYGFFRFGIPVNEESIETK